MAIEIDSLESKTNNHQEASLKKNWIQPLAFGAAFFAAAAFAQGDFSKFEITTEKLSDTIYMMTGAGGNLGLSIGPDAVFLIDDHARVQLVCKLVDVRNRDWEDIAIGAGPVKGKNYLYVADIGDNQAQFDFKYIYRFEEPLWSKEKEKLITLIDTLVLRMPDSPRDAETLLIDPMGSDLFIISKREQAVGLYHAPYPFGRDTLLLNKVLTLPMTQIVSGSISADGQEVLLKDYDHVYYWKRSGKESLTRLLASEPVELPYEREPQGEAIGWSRDAKAFYTLSESTKEKGADLIVHTRTK